jgi:hypothetical protein
VIGKGNDKDKGSGKGNDRRTTETTEKAIQMTVSIVASVDGSVDASVTGSVDGLGPWVSETKKNCLCPALALSIHDSPITIHNKLHGSLRPRTHVINYLDYH